MTSFAPDKLAPDLPVKGHWPFFAYVYRLRFIRRWGLMRAPLPESVAEHSYLVAVLCHALASMRDDGGKAMLSDALILALYHDLPEVTMTDVPTPVKNFNQVIKQEMDEQSASVLQGLLVLLPSPLRERFEEDLAEAGLRKDVVDLVKAADTLAAYLECAHEVAHGNTEYRAVGDIMMHRLRSMHRQDVDQFLAQCAPHFSMTLDATADEGWECWPN